MNILIIAILRALLAGVFVFVFLKGCYALLAGWLWVSAAVFAVEEILHLSAWHVLKGRGNNIDADRVFSPMADSMFRLTVMVSFMICNILPAWMFLIFFYRDSVVSFVNILCALQKMVFHVRKMIQIDTVLQTIALAAIIVVCQLHSFGNTVVPCLVLGRHPGYWIMLAPVVFTVFSVADSTIANLNTVRGLMKNKKQGQV